MQKIYRLDPHVADLIAAGEVVERPASVVKELMENSIDAGATALTVEIRSGGMSAMRITDNGCGMSSEDAETAFLRHATSKLRDARGLEAIGTLGFRGEALAAISSVSRVELLTAEKDAVHGTRLTLEGGLVTSREDVGCPQGTTIWVRDLFFNTPARLKFMKNDRTEGAAVTAAVLRCALSHPEISIRYLRDGTEEFHTPGDGKPHSAVYHLLGRDMANGLLPVEAESDGISVCGYTSSPNDVHGNRTHQYFFVNGRCVRSKTLQAALENAYRNRLPVSRFPACVLYLTMPKSAVDVNVHPAKTEVRFLREKQVFDAVYYAVMGALDRETGSAGLQMTRERMPEPAPSPVRSISAPDVRKPEPAPSFSRTPAVGSGDGFYKRMSASDFAGFYRPAKPLVFHNETEVSYQTSLPMEEKKPEVSPAVELPAEEEEEDAPSAPFRLIGEALNTYILVEQNEELILIDKHAAHERMLFDKLVTVRPEVMSQQLLAPAVCRVGVENAAVVEEYQDELLRFGLEAENFGNGTVIVRRVPADVCEGDIPSLVEELCSLLSAGLSPEELRDKVLHTVACKAAIKAGYSNDPEELLTVARAVLEGNVRYCPHGRPVSVSLSRETIEKNFKRI